jgi:hypothetical protein
MYVSKSVNFLVIIYVCPPNFLAQYVNYGIVVGNMPSRNPTTKHSPREPKMKEAEIGKGSSMGTARKLEYAPRVGPVIKTTTNKYFS